MSVRQCLITLKPGICQLTLSSYCREEVTQTKVFPKNFIQRELKEGAIHQAQLLNDCLCWQEPEDVKDHLRLKWERRTIKPINIPPLGVSQTTMIPAVCSRPSSSQKQKMCFALFRIELKPPREDCP